MRGKLPVIALVVTGLIVYFQSLFNGFVWDDVGQVVENQTLRSLSNIPQFFLGSTFNPGGADVLSGIYYKPMMPIFFALLSAIFGQQAFYFHLLQVILHSINAVLVFFLLRAFFRETIAFFLSILFLVHPANVEAVVYVSALQDVLFFFFGMCALHLLRGKPVKIHHFLFISTLFLLSLLSKETGFLFIAIAFAYVFLFQKKHVGRLLVGAFLVCITYLFLRVEVANIPFQSVSYLPISRASIFERIISMPQIFFSYLKSFFAPVDFAIGQHWVVRELSFAEFYVPLTVISIFFLAVLLLGLMVWKKQKNQFVVFCFFFLWFLLGMLFHLQIFPLSMTVADRWFYLPMVGLLGMLGIALQHIVVTKRIWVLAAIVIIVGMLSTRTVARTLDWRDGLTLYGHDIKIAKESFDLENAVGIELFRAGRFNEAQEHLERSVSLNPLPINLTNLGLLYEKKGESTKAMEHYQRALVYENSYHTYEAMAQLMFIHGDSASVMHIAKEGLKKYPNNAKLWLMLALSQYKLGNVGEATAAAQRAFSLMPEDEYTHFMNELKL